MTTLADKAVVLGTGGGALTIAAELALKGAAVTLGDFPQLPDRGAAKSRAPS